MKKILYASSSNPVDVEIWSGLNYYIYSALKQVFETVDHFGPLAKPVNFLDRAIMSATERLTGKYLIWSHRESNARHMGRLIDQKVREGSYDAVFAPSTPPLSYVTAKVPLFAYQDATIRGLTGLYGSVDAVQPISMKQAMRVEAKALTRCSQMFYSSQWACDCAAREYGVPQENLCFVPFGANMPGLNENEVDAVIKAKRGSTLRLLFLGKDWGRKGGDIAVETARLLNDMGVPTELHLAGCALPKKHEDKIFITAHGYISKASQDGQSALKALMLSNHFLLLPTRAECSAVVFCEAGSYAVPTISTLSGGVGSVIQNGINGYTLQLEAEPLAYAQRIKGLVDDRPKYEALALSSFKYYQSDLNWNTCATRLKERMEAVAERRTAQMTF